MSAIDLTFDNANQHLAAVTENRPPLRVEHGAMVASRPVIGSDAPMSKNRQVLRRGMNL